MRRSFALPVVMFLVAVAAAPAGAQTLDQGYDSGDSVVIKGTVYVQPDQTVGDVLIVDGQVRVDGVVDGDVVSVSAPVLVTGSGTVSGDVISLSDDVTVVSGGTVGGDVVYTDKKPQVQGDATLGGKVRRIDAGELTSPASVIVAHLAIWLAFTLSSLALGLLLIWLAPRAADAALAAARTGYAPAIAWGLGVFLGLPVVAIVAIVTLVGIPLGLSVLLALLPLYAVGYTTTAWLLGRVVVGPPRGRVVSFLAGWGILRLIALVPVLGALAWLAATVFGLGVLASVVWRSRARREPAPATA